MFMSHDWAFQYSFLFVLFLKIFFLFLMRTIFKVCIEFVKILLLFNVLVSFCLLWALGSPTRDLTHNSCIGRRSLNHWTIREIPHFPSVLIFQEKRREKEDLFSQSPAWRGWWWGRGERGMAVFPTLGSPLGFLAESVNHPGDRPCRGGNSSHEVAIASCL